ncbi:MAG: NAD(P)/FAD-dependent oxidoreductase [Chitinophagales bacterium]|nr:NAD(P)/FAD-dependent oxidoreductase [Chitinophagales bacterium]
MSKKRIAIIGGGAAGIFCAIQLQERLDCFVTIYEKSNELLKKVRISGGGRCNVTHHYHSQAQFSKNYPRGSKIIKKNLDVFSPKDMYKWLESKGVKLKTEEDGRVFPVTDNSQTIINCFTSQLSKHNVKVLFDHELTSIIKGEDGFLLHFYQKKIQADFLIIATGGAQKPRELELYKNLKIETIDPVPSLFTFKINESDLTSLMGLSVPNVSVRIMGSDLREQGPVLVTHWGLSGPGILKLSAWGAFVLNELNYKFQVAINWTGEKSELDVRRDIEAVIEKNSQAKVSNRRLEKYPQRFWEYLLVKAEIESDKKWSELSKKNVNKLIQILINTVYEVNGKTTFKEEFVTAGGIDIEHLHSHSMESKLVPNMYFIGEITNIDGITGGFNFQNAWTSSVVCAIDITNKVKKSLSKERLNVDFKD